MTSSMHVTILPTSDSEVDAQLDGFMNGCARSVAQQTRPWRDVISSIDRDEPLFLGCREGGRLVGVLPAYRFEGPHGAILTSVPQAGPLGGVACGDDVDPEAVYAALLGAFVDLAADRGCALASVITSPFWEDDALYDRHLPPDYALANTCQVLDLAGAFTPDGMLCGGSENLRRNLTRARSGALVVDEEQSEGNVDAWYAIHETRHREIGATPLPTRLFTAALRHAVPAEKARFFFVRLADSGRMVGGGFYLHHGVVMDALMPSISSTDTAHAPAYMLAWHSMRWAAARGIRYYNWQASPPEGGVRRFKQQWGSRDHAYRYLTRVTGDVRPFLESSVPAVVAGYPWHYVLPFDRIGSTHRAGVSTRSAAWAAREGSRS
jgi:hypothetical protein